MPGSAEPPIYIPDCMPVKTGLRPRRQERFLELTAEETQYKKFKIKTLEIWGSKAGSSRPFLPARAPACVGAALPLPDYSVMIVILIPSLCVFSGLGGMVIFSIPFLNTACTFSWAYLSIGT